MDIREQILESNEDLEFFDESMDSALLGYAERAGGSNFVLYDKQKLIELFKDEPLHLKETNLLFTKASLVKIEKVEDGELLIADGFNDAIIGYAQMMEGNHIVIYDSEKCIDILAKDFEKEAKEENREKIEGEDDEDFNTMAIEYFYYNTAGAYVG